MKNFDITIVGGGLIGTTLAIALGHSHWRVALVEAQLPSQQLQTINEHDTRSLALSYASKLFFTELGLWKEMQEFSTPIENIHASEEKRFGKVLLNAKNLDLETFGYVIPIPKLYGILQKHVEKFSQHIQLISPAKLKEIHSKEKNWKLVLEHPSCRALESELLIAADGDRSFIREYFKLPIKKIDYHQTAIVSTAQVSKNHFNTAYQRFTSKGVLAILPRENNYVAIIWTTDNKNISTLQHDFLAQTQRTMGYRLGRFSSLGTIQTYPLKFLHAQKQTLPGLILLGNAAHVLHPVAAQGLNLGLRDVQFLSTILIQEDNVHLRNSDLYQQYLDQRASDQLSTERFTERLIKIFSPQNFIFSHLRSAGLLIFDLIPSIQREFCLKRMGLL